MSTGLQKAHNSLVTEALSQAVQSYVAQTDLLAPTTTTGTPAAGTFYSTIPNRAKIPNLANDLFPRIGVERLMTSNIQEIIGEQGQNGERVYGVVGDDRGLVRFVGDWYNVYGTSGQNPVSPATVTSSYIEVTFYGTGINFLSSVHNGALDWRYSVDGGAETSFLPAQSSVLGGRNYAANVIVPVVKGLPLGIHTVKIRKNDTISGFTTYGFELLNESSNLLVAPGTAYINGHKTSLPSQQSFQIWDNATKTSIKTGFDSGSISDRGGRVLTYLKQNGTIGRAATAVPPNSGTELISNGTFNTDVNGWASIGNGSIQWNAEGSLSSDTTGSTYWDAYQTVSGLVVGRQYTFRASYNRSAGWTVALRIRDTANTIIATYVPNHASQNSGINQGEIVFQWIATATTAQFGFYFDRGGVSTVRWDNVSLKEESSRFMTQTDHSNEELIRSYSFREFGSGRPDDWSSLMQSNATKTFTLEDGITTLAAGNAYQHYVGNAPEGFGIQSAGSYWAFTFVGTGLDVVIADPGGTLDGYTILVDGFNVTPSVVFTDGTGQSASTRVKKICSNLPYGTHVVRATRSTAIANHPVFCRFNVYGPKKPILPSDCIELADYNMTANFDASKLAATSNDPAAAQGTIRKMCMREMLYSGSWANAQSLGYPSGFHSVSNTAGSYVDYTFFGTGFSYVFGNNSAIAHNITVSVNGSSNLSPYTTQLNGTIGMNFTPASGTIGGTATQSFFGNYLTVSGLNLGIHTVRITYNSGGPVFMGALDIITPIHVNSDLNKSFQNSTASSVSGTRDLRKLNFIKSDFANKNAVAKSFGINSASTSALVDVPMPDMSLTVTTKGGKLLISYNAMCYHGAAAGLLYTNLYVNGQPASRVKVGQYINTSQVCLQADTMILENLPAGTYKIDVMWRTNTGTINAWGDFRNIIAVEL
jgi:hypothetical protein